MLGFAPALVGALLLAAPGAAVAEPVCNEQDFCVQEAFTLNSFPPGMVAGGRLDLDLSVENASSPLDRADWMQSVTVALGDGESEVEPPLTPSASLPDGLLLAGGGTCEPPTYAGCNGGNGTFVLRSTFSSEVTGAFGVGKVVNVNPPAAGTWAHYELVIRICINTEGSCEPFGTKVMQVEIPPEAASELTVPTEAIEFFPGFGSVEYSLTSLTLHLNGQSNQIDGLPPAPNPYTVLAVPRDCGPVSATSNYVSRESGEVSFPHAFSVTGCPTAALSPYVRSGATIELDGGTSAPQVSEREISSWHWDLGDGTEAVTTTPNVTHDYPPGTEHTVSLVVEDSAGARSAPATQTVTMPFGSLLTVEVSGPGTVSGGSGGVEGDAISCPPTCTAIYPPGTSTSLAATPAAGFVLAGWGGDCAGTGPCALTMGSARTVTATFGPPMAPSAPVPLVQPPSQPPNTKIKRSTVRKRVATFAFRALGAVDDFRCALARPRKRGKARFRPCESPRTYRRLKPGAYVFRVRAVGPGGPDPSPARKRFRIRP